jgi:single-stranded-DNA-specific exonuclease
VIGIVAGRLRERFRKPALIIGLDPATGIGKGSGRSQPGVNLGRAVQDAFDQGLLMAGGGHAMAAGLTMRGELVPQLRDFLDRALAEEGACAADETIEIDALITPAGASRALLEDFQQLQPFGPGNPEPSFALADVRIEQAMPMRGGHLRCQLADAHGARLKAVAWRCADTALGRRLAAQGGALHVAGRLKADDWNGRQGVQLEIEDAADPRMSA